MRYLVWTQQRNKTSKSCLLTLQSIQYPAEKALHSQGAVWDRDGSNIWRARSLGSVSAGLEHFCLLRAPRQCKVVSAPGNKKWKKAGIITLPKLCLWYRETLGSRMLQQGEEQCWSNTWFPLQDAHSSIKCLVALNQEVLAFSVHF